MRQDMRTHPDRIPEALLSLHPVIGSAVREMLRPFFGGTMDNDTKRMIEQIDAMLAKMEANDKAWAQERLQAHKAANKLTFRQVVKLCVCVAATLGLAALAIIVFSYPATTVIV